MPLAPDLCPARTSEVLIDISGNATNQDLRLDPDNLLGEDSLLGAESDGEKTNGQQH